MRSGKRRHPETPHIDNLAVPGRDVVRESRRYITTECAPPSGRLPSRLLD